MNANNIKNPKNPKFTNTAKYSLKDIVHYQPTSNTYYPDVVQNNVPDNPYNEF